MIIIKKIENYHLYDNEIYYYLNDGSNVLYIYTINNKTQEIKIPGTSHWLFQDKKYLRTFQGECFLIKEKQLLKLEHEYRGIIENIGEATDYSKSDGVTHKEQLFKLPEETPILKDWLPNSIRHIQDQYWINDSKEDLKLIDAEKGEILWTIKQPEVEDSYDYKGITNTKKVLGIYKDSLWIQLPDSRFWVININDGTIKHELSHEYFVVDEKGSFFDPIVGTIKIFFYHLFALYSLDLMEFVEELDLGDPEVLRITAMISRPKDRYIYYTAKLNDIMMASNAYGVFDTESKQIVFQAEEIEEDGHFYTLPQVNDHLFTILDDKGNLLIHERKDIGI